MEIVSSTLAALALVFSIYTFFAHDRRLKRQEKLLNEYQLRSLALSEDENKKQLFELRQLSIKVETGHCISVILASLKQKI